MSIVWYSFHTELTVSSENFCSGGGGGLKSSATGRAHHGLAQGSDFEYSISRWSKIALEIDFS